MPKDLTKELDIATREFYVNSLKILNNSDIPFLLGGAYALAEYADVHRHTRDLDLFVKEEDCQRVLDLLGHNGYRTELTFSHWLGKAFFADEYIDVIFSSGNAVARVDNDWFKYSSEATVFGVPVRLCPPEEVIWSKSYVMERERFDGADIAHIIRARASVMDWDRLLKRFGAHWRLLLSHLMLFTFVYPDEKDAIPASVMSQLLNRAQNELSRPAEPTNTCQGPLISREQYLVDVDLWHYSDPRLMPQGNMSKQQIAQWTAAIASK